MMARKERRLFASGWRAAGLGSLILAVLVGLCFLVAPWTGSAAAVPTGPIGASIKSDLARQGITVQDISDSSAVGPSTAVSAAQAGIPLTQGHASIASLVSFSDAQTGPVQSDGSVNPTYVNREAWAVVFAGVPIPFLGPAGSPTGSYNSNTVVFVDAKTGDYLEAIAIAAN